MTGANISGGAVAKLPLLLGVNLPRSGDLVGVWPFCQRRFVATVTACMSLYLEVGYFDTVVLMRAKEVIE